MSRSPQHPQLSSIRERVRALIAQRGYTSVEKFAHEHNIEQSILSRFLSGNRDLMLSTVLRISEALNVDLSDLLSKSVIVKGPSPHYQSKPAQRLRIKVVLTEVASLTVLRTPNDKEPLVFKGSSKK